MSNTSKKSDLVVALDKDVAEVFNEVNEHLISLLDSINKVSEYTSVNQEAIVNLNGSVNSLCQSILSLNDRILILEKKLGVGSNHIDISPDTNNIN